MNPSRDKFIVEWFGGCWHEWKRTKGHMSGNYAYNADKDDTFICVHCKQDKDCVFNDPDFDTYEGFGLVWGWMRKDKLAWRKFLVYLDNRSNMDAPFQVINLIDTPSKFADAVHDFLKGQR